MLDVDARSYALLRDWSELRVHHPRVIVVLSTGDGVTIERIQTWPQRYRRRGLASAALATCCRLGDRHQVPLLAYPWPFTGRTEDRLWLSAWIRKYGFSGDVTDVGSVWMRRPFREGESHSERSRGISEPPSVNGKQ